MVSTVTSYSDIRNRVLVGQGYDGVVLVSVGGYYGTGVLLYDGQAVLTAAHLFSHGSSLTTVQFQTTASKESQTTSNVSVLGRAAAKTECNT